jgi:hypothetical protein
MHTDRYGISSRQKCHSKGSRKETKRLCIEIQRMVNMKCMMLPAVTGANTIVTKGVKKSLEAVTRKTLNRFTTKDSCTCDITRNTESAAV